MTRIPPDADGSGAPDSADHERFLLALGRATYEATALSKGAYDVLTVVGEVDGFELFDDPLGRLEGRLRAVAKRRPDIHEFADYLRTLAAARETRNDLLHALTVHWGLHRRRTSDHDYERNFYSVASLEECARQFAEARRVGEALMNRNDGEEVRRYFRASR